jgi:hypothetical protein
LWPSAQRYSIATLWSSTKPISPIADRKCGELFAAAIGSNDVAFGNGNVELLQFNDLAAASAGRIIATLLGPSLPAPTRVYRAFHESFPRNPIPIPAARLVAGVTTPSIALTGWLSVGTSGC